MGGFPVLAVVVQRGSSRLPETEEYTPVEIRRQNAVYGDGHWSRGFFVVDKVGGGVGTRVEIGTGDVGRVGVVAPDDGRQRRP